MAKFLSLVYSSIRGKVGGLVYTKNQFAGLVVRAFTAPTNPGTEPQSLIRSSFDEASIVWQELTQVQRDSWNAYAATLVYEGPHGTYKLPGRQVFMSNYTLASYMEANGYGSAATNVDPPLIAGFLNIGPVNVVDFVTASETGVAFSVGNPGVDPCTVLAQISIGYNQTKNVHRGPWITAQNQGLDIAAASSATGTFAGLVVDKAYFMRIIAVSESAPLRVSAPYFLRSVAVTNGP